MQKLIVYTAVIAFAGVGGLMAGFLMSNAEPAPDIATPVPLADQAAEAAAGAAERDPSTRPRVTLTQLDGSRAAIDDWAGQPLLVNFWATWCAPCLREIPLLKSIQDDAPIEGLQILGVAHDELDPVRDFVDEMGFNYPVLVGEFEAMAAAEAFGVELIALPLTLAISSSGEWVGTHMGELDAEEADAMLDVMTRLESGELSLKAARAALEL